jgi:hypothetical protein
MITPIKRFIRIKFPIMITNMKKRAAKGELISALSEYRSLP